MGINIDSAFPSEWLKAADLEGRDVTVTIKAVEIREVGKDKEELPVVYFEKTEKGLVLNKTNANNIKMITRSSNTDDWIGQQITLFSTYVDFAGQSVEAIRVKPTQMARQNQRRDGVPSYVTENPPVDDEIPF